MITKEELGKRIKKAREYKSKKIGRDYTQNDLARDIGKVRNYISNLEQGLNYPNAAVLLEIAKACDVPPGFFGSQADYENENDLTNIPNIEDQEFIEEILLHLNSDKVFPNLSPKVKEMIKNKSTPRLTNIKLFSAIPVLKNIRAGEPMYAEQNIISYVPIPNDNLDGGEYFGLLVHGDGMNNSAIVDGSYAIVRKQSTVENGEIAAVLVNGDEVTIRVFHQTDTVITLIPNSSNPEHKPRFIDITKTDVRVLGKVVMTINKIK